MKIFVTASCLFLLLAVCVAEEMEYSDWKEYFDWKGNKLSAARNYTGALIYFNKSISQDPGYLDAWVHKGDTQKIMGNYNASIESYQRAVQLNNTTKAAWSGIIDAYMAVDDYPDATKAAAEVTKLDPINEYNWLREGSLLQTQTRFKESLVKYDGALKLDPKYTDALYQKGVSLIATGNNSGAISLFDQVLAIDPKYKYAYNAKGFALEAEGEYAEAQSAYDKALEIDPMWSTSLINRMNALMAKGKDKEAMDIFFTIW